MMRSLRLARAGARPLSSALGVRARSTAQAVAADPPSLPKPRPSLATATFDWRDALDLSASLTDDEQAMYEAAVQFAQAELLPGLEEPMRKGLWGLKQGVVWPDQESAAFKNEPCNRANEQRRV